MIVAERGSRSGWQAETGRDDTLTLAERQTAQERDARQLTYWWLCLERQRQVVVDVVVIVTNKFL